MSYTKSYGNKSYGNKSYGNKGPESFTDDFTKEVNDDRPEVPFSVSTRWHDYRKENPKVRMAYLLTVEKDDNSRAVYTSIWKGDHFLSEDNASPNIIAWAYCPYPYIGDLVEEN